jgi:hypothetical protein
LKGDATVKALGALQEDLKKVFHRPGPGIGKSGQFDTGAWPDGFVLQGYNVCQWEPATEADADVYDYPFNPTHSTDIEEKKKAAADNEAWPNEIMFNFRAEVHRARAGSLYLNRLYMLPDVEWFYHYRKYRWHKDLTKRLIELNTKHQALLIERIWYRDWQWYCGNGGC